MQDSFESHKKGLEFIFEKEKNLFCSEPSQRKSIPFYHPSLPVEQEERRSSSGDEVKNMVPVHPNREGDPVCRQEAAQLFLDDAETCALITA